MGTTALVTLSAVAKSGFSPSPSFSKLHNQLLFLWLYPFVVVARQQLRFNTLTMQISYSIGDLFLESIFAERSKPELEKKLC
jgi:bacteriorhodopsin